MEGWVQKRDAKELMGTGRTVRVGVVGMDRYACARSDGGEGYVTTATTRGNPKGRLTHRRRHGIHETRSQPHTRRRQHLRPAPRLMLHDNRVDDVLRGVVPERGEVIAHVRDVVPARVVRLSGVHRVVRPGARGQLDRRGLRSWVMGRRMEHTGS